LQKYRTNVVSILRAKTSAQFFDMKTILETFSLRFFRFT